MRKISFFICLFFVFYAASSANGQQSRKSRKEIRKSLKVLISDLRILKNKDNANYLKFIKEENFQPHRLSILYDKVDRSLRDIKKDLQDADRRYKMRTKKLAKLLKHS